MCLFLFFSYYTIFHYILLLFLRSEKGWIELGGEELIKVERGEAIIRIY